MSNYPINGGDDQSLLDAVNYAVSGPSGLGQQLQGFSSSDSAQLTGNYRIPYSSSYGRLYVAPIALSTSEWLDDYTWKFTFATAQSDPPFALGNGVTISGVTPSDYDDTYSRVGVVQVTDTYVILRGSRPYPNPGVVGTGGTASLFVTSQYGATMSTDANAIVSVDAGNNLVSVTGQLDLSAFDYMVTYTNYPVDAPQLNVYVELNRYQAFNSGTAANPQYYYNFDKTIASQLIYNNTITAYSQGIPLTFNIISGTSGPASVGFYPDVSPNYQTGDGSNVRIYANITADSTDYSTSLDITSVGGGGNYQVGDTLTFRGDQFGGTSPENDLVLEVATIGSNPDITAPASLTIFTPIVDNPTSGLYWYILEVDVAADSACEVAVKSMTLNRRSLTAQVLKK